MKLLTFTAAPHTQRKRHCLLLTDGQTDEIPFTTTPPPPSSGDTLTLPPALTSLFSRPAALSLPGLAAGRGLRRWSRKLSAVQLESGGSGRSSRQNIDRPPGSKQAVFRHNTKEPGLDLNRSQPLVQVT